MLFLFIENDKIIYSTLNNETLLEVLKPDVNVELPGKKFYKILRINKTIRGSVESYMIEVENAKAN